MDQLENTVKARDEKRERSQQAIKETLKNLEDKLQMFTEQSQQNKGGLRQITQSPFESKRPSCTGTQAPNARCSGPGVEDIDAGVGPSRLQFVS